MSIKYKVIERGEPGVVGGGVKKFYATPVQDGELSLDELTTAIEKSCTVNGADIRAVLYAMVDEAVANLADGRIIRFGDLGSLRISLSSEGKATSEEVNANCIKTASVIFTPGSKIKNMLATAKYSKVQ
jgi:predicted histone-like DNA-binding protein